MPLPPAHTSARSMGARARQQLLEPNPGSCPTGAQRGAAEAVAGAASGKGNDGNRLKTQLAITCEVFRKPNWLPKKVLKPTSKANLEVEMSSTLLKKDAATQTPSWLRTLEPSEDERAGLKDSASVSNSAKAPLDVVRAITPEATQAYAEDAPRPSRLMSHVSPSFVFYHRSQYHPQLYTLHPQSMDQARLSLRVSRGAYG